MTGQITARIELALAGALGGVALWAAIEALDKDWLGDYPALVVFVLVGTVFSAVMAMAGPIGLWRAVPRALGLGLVVAALVWLTALRYAGPDDFVSGAIPVLAAFTVAALPVPFLIAQVRSR
ncbi:MAG: hypothetical protein V4630_14455, partial [Pseudomonadota bacterium]